MTRIQAQPVDTLVSEMNAAAEAATQGERFWAIDKINQPTNLMTRAGDYVLSPQVDMGDYGLSADCWVDMSKADEAFTVIANPANVLILLAEIERLKAGHEAMKATAPDFVSVPLKPSYKLIKDLAHEWAYNIEEASESYQGFLAVVAKHGLGGSDPAAYEDEVEDLAAQVSSLSTKLVEMEREIERLTRDLELSREDYGNADGEAKDWEQRATEAEARLAESEAREGALREALTKITKIEAERVTDDFVTGPQAHFDAAKRIARAALTLKGRGE